MSISVACQECGRLLRVKDELAGKRIKCPHCRFVQPVPREEALAEHPEPPAQPPPPREAAKTPEALLAEYTARRKRARILQLAALIGFLYGLVSAFGNQNPYYGWFTPGASSLERLDKAGAWKPSPVWLPSYVLCSLLVDGRNGVGIYYERFAGYYFQSVGGWLAFYEASSLLGALLGAAVGAGVLALLRILGYVQPPLQLPGFRAVLVSLGWGALSLISGWIFMGIGGFLASLGATTPEAVDARALPVGLNTFIFGLAIPTLVRRWWKKGSG